MDSDPLCSFLTPPAKRRKLTAVLPSPPKLPDLLASFGARRLPMSASRMEREAGNRELRPAKKTFTYAESGDSSTSATPKSSPGKSSFYGSPESTKASPGLHDSPDSEDELQQNRHEEANDEDEIVVAAPHSSAVRELRNRSTRAQVSYATPKRALKKKTSISKLNKARNPIKLTSDLTVNTRPQASRVETERSKVRSDIAEHTKPKRNAFLLANKEHFLPLLPETSYIDKLQRLEDMDSKEDPEVASYTHITSQPTGIQATLKPYQLEGLSFLVYMHKNGMSAILGDEMGLGKTLQTLSLFQYLKQNEPTKGENRPYLVICPLSVLSSWMSESKKWVPYLRVVRFHGPKVEREKLKDDCRVAGKASKIDVIVTTYETFLAEQGWFKRAFVWRYCVLDEGHKIKNNKSDVAHSLQGLTAEYRVLLTGTPLQNNLAEMWALLHWLYPDVFTADTADNFNRAFDLTKGKVSPTFMDDARRLLELVMLRRMKNSPGVDLGLPPKEEVLLYVPLTPMQRFWYTRFLTKADGMMLDELFKGAKAKEVTALKEEAEEDKKQLGLLEKAAEEMSDPNASNDDVWAESKEIMEQAIQSEQADINSNQWRKLMNLILQLRKICSHPYILPHAAPEPYYLGDHVKTASGKFIVLDKLVEKLVMKQGKKILIFAGLTKCLDLCEDLLTLKGGNAFSNAAFRYLRLDGSTARAKRNLGIRLFNDSDSEFKVMLISTRAGGLGINLASASDVVFMDEDWNPQITIQAEARAHRIGQTQKVTVYKLCTQGTVEEQMMGRIRKKLYLSAKITESMRNIHSTAAQGKKRKRGPSTDALEEEAPQLDATSLKSLIRRGAQTLSKPEVNVTEMLDWNWETMLEMCKDKPINAKVVNEVEDTDEESWLNSLEKVECAVFEGKKHQKVAEKAAVNASELSRSDRRIGKNTTVMVDGFAINKESLTCGDWEAVPTMAGKDPRLAEPVREKKAAINSQDVCQHCWDGGEVVTCRSCPRSYHLKCLDKPFKHKAVGAHFFCPQHECVDCQAKTAEAGGLMYRCRWCERGYCEDCLDWEAVKLIGATIPEYEMLGFEGQDNAWYIECPTCIRSCEANEEDAERVAEERKRIDAEYEEILNRSMALETESVIDETPATISEVGTPVDVEFAIPKAKKGKMV